MDREEAEVVERFVGVVGEEKFKKIANDHVLRLIKCGYLREALDFVKTLPRTIMKDFRSIDDPVIKAIMANLDRDIVHTFRERLLDIIALITTLPSETMKEYPELHGLRAALDMLTARYAPSELLKDKENPMVGFSLDLIANSTASAKEKMMSMDFVNDQQLYTATTENKNTKDFIADCIAKFRGKKEDLN